jgi:hypothetical protein
MNRVLTTLAAGAFLASGAALACDDMKITGDYDGGVIASRAPAAPAATTQKVSEPPLVVTQKQSPVKKSTTAAKPLPEGVMVTKTGS